jgi:hypothetical protein
MPEGGRIAFALVGSGPAIGLFRVVQITPAELACSIIFGKGVRSAAPGSADGLHLIVSREARIGREWRGRYAAYMLHEKAGGELPA